MRKAATPSSRHHSSKQTGSACNLFNIILLVVIGWLGFLYYCHVNTGKIIAPETAAMLDKVIPHDASQLLHSSRSSTGAQPVQLVAQTAAAPDTTAIVDVQTRLSSSSSQSSVVTPAPVPYPPRRAPIKQSAHKEEKHMQDVIKKAGDRASSPTPVDDEDLHIVFSTDCTFFQDWQTLLVFHSAKAVKQKGSITRIASGCDEQKKKDLVALYHILYPEYGVHFTPDFKKDGKTKKKYDFYNKPYGVHHWLLNTQPPVRAGTVVILLDPDMIFMRPITAKVAGNENNLFLPYFVDEMRVDKNVEPPVRVEHGTPVAQLYGLGAPWASNSERAMKNFNRTEICGVGSVCTKDTMQYGHNHFSVGPPYLLEKEDLLTLTSVWTEFVPKVYARYPNLLAEMYAYSMAASHTRLPHFTMRNLMVSNTHASDEGWQWVDALGDNVCEPPVDGIYYPGKPLPNVLHFCQFFRAGELGFQKRRIRMSIFNCEKPMMIEPGRDLGKVTYKNRDGEIIKLNRVEARRNAFMLSVIHRSINAMVTDYKRKMCDPRKPINLNKTLNVVDPSYDKV